MGIGSDEDLELVFFNEILEILKPNVGYFV